MKSLRRLTYGFMGIAIIGIASKAISEEVDLKGLSKQEVLAISLIAKDENIRENAKKNLIALGEKAIPILKKCLEDEYWYKRFQAVNVLGEIKTVYSDNLLLKVALEDEKYEVGLLALQMLKEKKTEVKTDTSILISILKKYNFHEHALNLVREDTTSDRVANLLIKALFDKNAWQTKRDIARKLGELYEIDPKVRAKPLLEMIRRECKTPTPIETGGDGGGPIDYSGLQEYYLYPLTMIGTSAVPFLKEAFNKEKDNRVKEWIVIALGNLKQKEVFSVLCKMALNAEDGWIRTNAILALGEFKDKKAISVLKKALQDEFWVEDRGCVRVPGHEYLNIHYPVRSAAYSVLLDLGIKVEVEKHRYTVIEE